MTIGTSTEKAALERKVIDAAMADYRRLRRFGWTGEELGGKAKTAFMACKRLDKFLGKKK